jgi:hypothetical protein
MQALMALRTARVFIRQGVAIGLALLLVLGSVLASWQISARLDLKPGPNEYNIAAWEVRNLPGKWLFLLGEVFRGRASEAEQDEKLLHFFTLAAEVERLERRLGEAAQRDTHPEAALLADLDDKRRERDRLENQVEATIESRLSKVIKTEGLTRSFLNVVWPPVDFEFTDAPRALATSRRDRIELLGSILLREDLNLYEIERIEAETAARDHVSALAFPTGGIGAYPTIIDQQDDYARAVEVIAHEWMHNYLFFRPLGFNYYGNNDLRTMNETVADLVGRELARAVVARWPLPAAQPDFSRDEESPPTGPRVDAGAELRRLRAEVDALLEDGKIAEAEWLMEQQRQELAAAGHFIRKINQAYFAYLNLYAGEAGSPAAVNPIGPKIDELRRASASLKEFVDVAGSLTSVDALDRALQALGAR